MPKRKLEKQSTTLSPVVSHVLASACVDWLLLSFICFAAAGETPALPANRKIKSSTRFETASPGPALHKDGDWRQNPQLSLYLQKSGQ
jgi:hypothetical protein